VAETLLDLALSSVSPAPRFYTLSLHDALPIYVWILFGTFPFFPCSPEPSHRALWRRVQMTPNTTIRNDPDGRSRLNVDGMTGRIRVTDFGNPAPLGSILDGVTLPEAFARYQEDLSYKPYRCVCPEAGCLGPNGIVARTYFQDV